MAADYTDTSINELIISKISQAKYLELSSQGMLNENELYIVENETLDAMGHVVTNVADPSALNDAANKSYVDTAISALSASIPPPVSPSDAVPQMDLSTGSSGISTDYSRSDHVHPAETSVSNSYFLPSPVFPIQYEGIDYSEDEITFEFGSYGSYEGIAMLIESWPDPVAVFSISTLTYEIGETLYFNGESPSAGYFPTLLKKTAIAIRGNEVAQLSSPNFTGIPTAPTAVSGTSTTQIATTEFVQSALATIDVSDQLNTKLNSTATAPDFQTSATYFINEYVTLNGALYRCLSAITTSGDFDPTKWELVDMTTPDATLDITSAGKLRVVGADGTIMWQEGYNLAVSSTVNSGNLYLSTDALNGYSFGVNSISIISVNLPTASSGKVGDLIVDVMNLSSGSEFLSTATYAVGDEVFYGGNLLSCNTAVTIPGDWATVSGSFTVIYSAFDSTATYSVGNVVVYDGALWQCVVAVSTAGDWTGTANWQTASFVINGLDNTVSIVVPSGEDLGDMLTFAPGTMCELYFTQTAFQLNSKPTWKVVRQDVEDGGAS